MKSNSKLALFLVFCCTIILFESCFISKNVNIEIGNMQKKNIIFISKMNYGYHWATIKQGAVAASKEFNVNISFEAPEKEENADEQIKLLQEVIENKEGNMMQ